MGAGMVTVLYLLANVAYLSALPLRGNEERAQQLERVARVAEKEGLQDEAQAKLREATFVRGIDHAKDDRVGTALMELVWPRYVAPFMAIGIMLFTLVCAHALIYLRVR